MTFVFQSVCITPSIIPSHVLTHYLMNSDYCCNYDSYAFHIQYLRYHTCTNARQSSKLCSTVTDCYHGIVLESQFHVAYSWGTDTNGCE